MEYDETEIHRDIIDDAYDRWTRIFGESSFIAFWKFIGTAIPKARGTYSHFYSLPPESVQRLNMLLGPNYVAIIKAYKIQHKKERK